jgi:hypothetical protein
MATIAQHFGHSDTREKMPTGASTCDYCIHKLIVDLGLNPRRHPNLHGRAFLVRWLENGLPIDIQQQTDPEQTSDEIRASITDKGQR